ncbi:MAG TPA: hypothetical protein VLA09_06255 [Longimicrobiales bacterium]|nr:hypothetical protein [Longimicrobiales bacterium]
MEHLTVEALARLVDESPRPEEQAHLSTCERCAELLTSLEEQTEALAALPEIMPPKGDWDALEARLRSEGLVEDAGLVHRLALTRAPAWMPAAAAIVLFLGGTAFGAGITTRNGGAESVPELARVSTVEDAATALRAAEDDYVFAVSRYRELLETQGSDPAIVDPISRYAALENLVSVSQAAVRQAPGDPFLYGFLASALAERDAAARVVSAAGDNWF